MLYWRWSVGGGWYGGGGGGPGNHSGSTGGGGGSGYVYTSSTSSNYPNGCKLNSSYYLINTSMLTGQRSGNGQAKITLVN